MECCVHLPEKTVKTGICAYPLSRGKETGRGLERVIQALTDSMEREKISHDFLDRGIIRSEFKAILSAPGFLRFLSLLKYDCYLAVYPVAAMFPLLAKKKPLVTAVHDLIPFLARGYDNNLKYALKRACIRRACRKSDALIVGFPSIKSEIIRLFGVPEEKITVAYYGVEQDKYYPDSRVKKIKNRVAFLGEAKRAKGIDSLIRAFPNVLSRVPDATLVLASGGHELEAMKKLAADLLPRGSYEFAGFVPEEKMREFYNAADVFVFPSRYGFGLSALEAMACGTPAILGACLDSMDFISDKDLLADPENPREISGKITALLTDRVLHAQKSEQAIKIASQFSWEKMARRYHEVCVKTAEKYSAR